MPRSKAVGPEGAGGAGANSGRPLRMDRGESVVSTVDGFEWIESSDMRFDSGRLRGGAAAAAAAAAAGGADGADAGADAPDSPSVVFTSGRIGFTSRMGFTGSGKSLTLASGGGGGGSGGNAGASPEAPEDDAAGAIPGNINPLLMVSLSLASSLGAAAAVDVAGIVLPNSKLTGSDGSDGGIFICSAAAFFTGIFGSIFSAVFGSAILLKSNLLELGSILGSLGATGPGWMLKSSAFFAATPATPPTLLLLEEEEEGGGGGGGGGGS